MPWKECKLVDERLKFVARLLDGEKMAPVCREFGISRVTGYKILNRFKDYGIDGLNDRKPKTLSACQSAVISTRKDHLTIEAGISELGSTQDPGQTDSGI
jgi:transposase